MSGCNELELNQMQRKSRSETNRKPQEKTSELKSEVQTEQPEVQSDQTSTKTEQPEMRCAQPEMRCAQSEMQCDQSEIRSTQSEIRSTQSEMRSTQSDIRCDQLELQSDQFGLKSDQPNFQSEQTQLSYIPDQENSDNYTLRVDSDDEKPKKALNMKPGAVKIREWLNRTVKVEMSDHRVLIGVFLCTDREANIILGSCAEYLPSEDANLDDVHLNEEARMLGLVMIPGRHIVSIHIDQSDYAKSKGVDVKYDIDDLSEDIV